MNLSRRQFLKALAAVFSALAVPFTWRQTPPLAAPDIPIGKTYYMPTDFATFTEAMEALQPGDTLVVQGTYHEPLVVNKSHVTISGYGAMIVTNDNTAITVKNCEDVVLEGFTCIGSGRGAGMLFDNEALT